MQAKPWLLPYIAVQTLMVVAVHTSRILCSCAPSPTLEDIPNNTENKRCSASTPMWLHNSSVACELLRAHLMSNTLHDLLLTRSWPSVVDSSVLVGPPVPLCPSLAAVPSVPVHLPRVGPLRAAQTLAHLGLRALCHHAEVNIVPVLVPGVLGPATREHHEDWHQALGGKMGAQYAFNMPGVANMP